MLRFKTVTMKLEKAFARGQPLQLLHVLLCKHYLQHIHFFQQRKRIEKKIFVKQRYSWLGFQQYWRLWCRGCHKKKPSNWTRNENQIWEIKHKQKQSANNRFSTQNLYSFRWVFFLLHVERGCRLTHTALDYLWKAFLFSWDKQRVAAAVICHAYHVPVVFLHAMLYISYPIHAPLPLFYMHTRTHITSRHR